MNTTGSITIAFSKIKLFKLLSIAVVFTGLGSWMLLVPPNDPPTIMDHPLIKNGVALGCILLGLLGIAMSLYRMLKKRPAILIDDQGITDNSSPVSAGYIPWSDVHLITTSTVVHRKLILLMVKNPEAYILRQKNIIIQKGMRMNFRNYGSPVCISASGLQCTIGELERQIEMKLAAHKRQGSVRPI